MSAECNSTGLWQADSPTLNSPTLNNPTLNSPTLNSPNKTPLYTGPDYNKPHELWLTEPDTLRRLVGVLGMALPWLLILTLWWDNGHGVPLESISHYYFTRVSAVFTTTVSLMAIFLLIYKGEHPGEFWLSTLAGIGGLLLVLFPTDNIVDKIAIGTPDCIAPGDCNPSAAQYTAMVLRISSFRTYFHYAASGLFLGCLALLSIWVFAYSKQAIARASPTAARRMRQRNLVYRLCGMLMLLAILLVFIGDRLVGKDFYDAYHLTFWLEVVAVESFGISWLLRGDAMLRHVE
jgi:hypothetical protein